MRISSVIGMKVRGWAFLAGAMLFAFLPLTRGAAAAGGELFQPATETAFAVQRPISVTRQRIVSTDRATLMAARRGNRLTLNFFDDATATAVIDRYWRSGSETFNWEGRIEGSPHSMVLFVMHKGVVAGVIRAPGLGAYRIRWVDPNRQVIEEVDDLVELPCGVTEAHARSGNGGHAHVGGVAGESCGSLIDVMIVYTPAARALMAGQVDPTNPAPIEAQAVLNINQTNFVFENSQIETRVRLVYTGEVIYDESFSGNTDLNRLTDLNDGFMDEVHPLRDLYGADIVCLFVSDFDVCGIAWLMSNPSVTFEDLAFNVNAIGCCIPPLLTLQHEIGHNLGCHHDHDNAGGSPAFDYSYGHRFTATDGNEYRTVMSYAPGIRIPNFSNPNILHLDTPMGIPGGIDGQPSPPDAADNARTINQTDVFAADFRPTAIPLPATWLLSEAAVGADTTEDDHFGSAVAMDGDVVIIGAVTDDTNVEDSGSAYIFRYDAKTATWVEESKLTAGDPASTDRFGQSVDVFSNDGVEVAIVGAPLVDGNGRNSGAAYIFRNFNGAWKEEAKIHASDHLLGDEFGTSVSIIRLSDGTEWALVGALQRDDNGTNSGAAYLFVNQGGEWVEHLKLLPSDEIATGDSMGYAVALAEDSFTGEAYAAVSALRDDDGGNDAGTVYVFRRDLSGEWSLDSKLMAQESLDGDQLGASVAMTSNEYGMVLVVGAHLADVVGTNSGAAYVFVRAPKTQDWHQVVRLLPPDGEPADFFGFSVDVAGDTAIVGAYLKDGAEANTGKAYIFRGSASGTAWTLEAELTAADAMGGDGFGYSVATNGEHAAVGTFSDDNLGPNTGSVYFTGATTLIDCNANGVNDVCDIALGTSLDENANGVPDECEVTGACCLPDDVCADGMDQATCEAANGVYQGDNTLCESISCSGGSPCPADINQDGTVDVGDLLMLLGAWGPCEDDCVADINGDDAVNVDDMLILLGAWGDCP